MKELGKRPGRPDTTGLLDLSDDMMDIQSELRNAAQALQLAYGYLVRRQRALFDLRRKLGGVA